MRSFWKDGDRTRTVELEPQGEGRWKVRVDDAEFELTAEPLGNGSVRLTTAGGAVVAEVTAAGNRRFVALDGMDFVLDREAAARKRGGADTGSLEAPMPGLVTRVMVAEGEDVKQGQPLLALEAMKMEHVLRAPRDGRVKKLAAKAGEMAQGGVALIELE
jgi:acetyl/propionyl-CoA carboxylase alpha subunit